MNFDVIVIEVVLEVMLQAIRASQLGLKKNKDRKESLDICFNPDGPHLAFRFLKSYQVFIILITLKISNKVKE